MSRWLRLVLTWLLAALLPVQGFAAGSMLCCAKGAHHAAGSHGGMAHHHHRYGPGTAPMADGTTDQAMPATAKGGRVHDAQSQTGPCGACASCCCTSGGPPASEVSCDAPPAEPASDVEQRAPAASFIAGVLERPPRRPAA